MAIVAKVSMLFNLARWGWSETWYYQNGTGGLGDAKSAALALLGLRLSCMSKTVVCDGVRVTDVTTSNNTVTTIAGDANSGNTNLPGQEPWAALLVGILAVGAQTGNVYRREFLMRGLPYSFNNWNTTNPTAPNLTPGGQVVVNAFLNKLTANAPTFGGAWSLKVSDKDAVANPIFPLGEVTVIQPGSFFAFAPLGSASFAVGDRIHIGKAKGYGIGGLVGDAVITAVNAGGVYVTDRRQCGPVAPVILTKPGTVRKKKTLYVPITEFAIERWVKRDTGRPFTVTAGRRRSRHC